VSLWTPETGEPTRFWSAYSRGFTVIPVMGDGVSAMSPARVAQPLEGLDSTTVLEAASTVLADIETGRFDAVAGRLDAVDGRAVDRWRSKARGSATVAKTPVHPLALLAATTLALGQSGPGRRDDAVRATGLGVSVTSTRHSVRSPRS
jgi:hypothetical protein